MSRITIQGRDWTTTSNGRANAERCTDRMGIVKSAPLKVWADSALVGVMVAAVIVGAVLL